jgi:phenylacetate-CoA ligase
VAVAAGVSSDDIAQICFGYGLFTGGFGMHFGIEKAGALVLPISSGGTERQIRFIKDFGTTTIVCTPTYALHLAETAKDLKIDLTRSSLRWGLFGGEPCSETAQQQLDRQLGIIATDNYGMSEAMGPGLAGECLQRDGMHINEDHFIVEMINPETGVPVEPGEVGEVVVTTLTKEAVPVIRYRTRDLSYINYASCACGRTNARMAKVMGRTDDMLIIKGVNVFPSQIEDLLLQVEHTEPHYQIVVYKEGALDALEIQVEVTEEMFDDEMRKLKSKEEEIRHKLKSELGIDCKVQLVEPKSLQRYTGKARRVIDRRKKSSS